MTGPHISRVQPDYRIVQFSAESHELSAMLRSAAAWVDSFDPNMLSIHGISYTHDQEFDILGIEVRCTIYEAKKG